MLRLAALLHDVGKPSCHTRGGDGVDHFYKHPAASFHLADQMMRRLKFDNLTRLTVCELIRYHDSDIQPTNKSVRRALNKLDKENFLRLLDVKRADNLAQNPRVSKRAFKRNQRENRVPRSPDGWNNSGLYEFQNGCKPARTQSKQPGDFPAFAENIDFSAPVSEYNGADQR